MLFGETVTVYCENHTEHTDTVCTSQETHYVSATKTILLMMFIETVTVYCENHTEHIYSPHLMGKTLRIRYRDQPVNAV
jgi:translation initiation factor IF-1